jgi:bifunctional non-homologous end joining protein LigD
LALTPVRHLALAPNSALLIAQSRVPYIAGATRRERLPILLAVRPYRTYMSGSLRAKASTHGECHQKTKGSPYGAQVHYRPSRRVNAEGAARGSGEHLHQGTEKGAKIISIDDIDGLVSLVQAGVLEIHTRGSTIDALSEADRLVFDLDPGPGTGWRDVVAAAHDMRARLAKIKLRTFLKTFGGKGLHVVLPIKPTPWEEAKNFCRAIARAMAADDPDRYTTVVSKSKRNNPIFIDYLRDCREATTVAPYSTRARPGAPVSVPIAWSELGSLKAANQYTVQNLPQRLARLRKDPWANIGRVKQALPQLR